MNEEAREKLMQWRVAVAFDGPLPATGGIQVLTDEEAEAFFGAYRELEEIVEKLASLEVPGSYGPNDCHMGDECETDVNFGLNRHSPDCPYLRAKKWVKRKNEGEK